MTETLTHTLGPWFVDGPPWNQIVWSSAENRVCFLAHSNGLDDDRDVATGHLIAASPDLIEFVVKVTNYLEYLPALLELGQMSGHAGNCTILAKQGRAAIAKATGLTLAGGSDA